MNIENMDELLAMPEGFKPSYDDLLAAVKMHAVWAIAEDKNFGSFHDKADMCSYAEWLTDKALGRPHQEVWEGVPQLIISFNGDPK